ncbi:hypothetical protein SY83_14175 [Paenibacillus swuensis]|uniref:Uncharacterized protein n=1 Tax=Paenibacillus swuensis TaxID=1178515 RepID=A0A172TKC6_9BACL|nr:hypothetical protein [Paenibacillus swuensis]ANE47223.1 hypothetical protein SY83_14175 [Paenibacillus swuensis]
MNRTDAPTCSVAEIWVTADGLRWNGNYYSCTVAIREGWYAQAASQGEWMIYGRVAATGETDDEARGKPILYIEQLGENLVCQTLSPRSEGHETALPDAELYYAAMQELKQMWKERRSTNRIKGRKRPEHLFT